MENNNNIYYPDINIVLLGGDILYTSNIRKLFADGLWYISTIKKSWPGIATMDKLNLFLREAYIMKTYGKINEFWVLDPLQIDDKELFKITIK